MDPRSEMANDPRWKCGCGSKGTRAKGQAVRLVGDGLTVVVDPGHGLGNRSAGVYDPGAVSGAFQEATIALAWAAELERKLMALGVKVVMTRRTAEDAAPLLRRAAVAREVKADALVSVHLNAFHIDGANGVETLWRTPDSQALAKVVQDVLVAELGLSDRGPKYRPMLAVLGFDPSVLIELGFITNAGDRARLLDDEVRRSTCRALARAVVAWCKERKEVAE